MGFEKNNKLFPPATIGVVGGGQLGKMFVFEAKKMGYNVIVLDPNENSPAGQVADKQILAGFDEMWAYRELAEESDVLTYEFEHINVEILIEIENEGHKIIPSARTLGLIQNKYEQKKMLKRIGVDVPDLNIINSLDDLKKEYQRLNHRVILKSCRNGYDGKGNRIIRNETDLENAYKALENQEVFAEELVDFKKEVSIVVVKNDTNSSFYPVVENVHRDSILIKTVIPADLSEDVISKIQDMSRKIVNELDDFGVFCIEFFIEKNDNVLVNEIAPRPHNSGHYTIEGCVCSQFEQLFRVVSGLPIGSTELRMPCVMYNILGNNEVVGEYSISGLDEVLNIKDCHLHLYGKQNTASLKKIGHITALGKTIELADAKAMKALKKLKINFKS